MPSPINTSGQGKDAPVPSEIRRWNWGAFAFSFIWYFFNARVTRESWREFLKPGYYWGIIFDTGLARRANTLAWRYKRWTSVEAYLRTQRRWAVASLAVAILFSSGIALLVVDFVRSMD